MAVPAQSLENRSLPQQRGAKRELTPFQTFVVKQMARGMSRNSLARLLAPKIHPNMDRSLAERTLRRKIRNIEECQWFRDLLYESAIEVTDRDIPLVLQGIRRKARMGRVDAARLVLEVTGRHNPRGEQSAPTVVQINFGGDLPRPVGRRTQIEPPVEDAEWSED